MSDNLLHWKSLLQQNAYVKQYVASYCSSIEENKSLLQCVEEYNGSNEEQAEDFIYSSLSQQHQQLQAASSALFIHILSPFSSTNTQVQFFQSILELLKNEKYKNKTREIILHNVLVLLSFTTHFDDELRTVAIECLLHVKEVSVTKVSKEQVLKTAKAIYESNYDIQNWMQHVEGYTFKTMLLHLSKKELETLIESYSSSQELPTASLEPLKQQVNEMIQNLGGSVFCKLSSRSPKDVNLEAAGLSLQVTSADQLLRLFQHSERIKTDLKDYLQTEGDAFIVCREWVTLNPELEFRAFICNSKLCAISAYHTQKKSSKSKKQMYQTLMTEFFAQVIPKTPFPHFIADVVIVEEENSVKIIEFNPFGKCSGAALFSWAADNDILTGKAPFEFRT